MQRTNKIYPWNNERMIFLFILIEGTRRNISLSKKIYINIYDYIFFLKMTVVINSKLIVRYIDVSASVKCARNKTFYFPKKIFIKLGNYNK